MNESVRSHMKPLSMEEIKEKLAKVPPHKILDYIYEMGLELTDVYTEEEILDLDPEVLLDYSFTRKWIKGIKYVLENYRLYGKDSRFIVSCYMPDITNKEDLKYLLNNSQILKFLNPDQRYLLEKYKLGMHQNETREYEEYLINLLKRLDYYQSKDNPDIMVIKKGKKNYFNYNKKTKKLTYHFDNTSGFYTNEDMDEEEKNEKSHRETGRAENSVYEFGSRYINILLNGVVGKYYGLDIENSDGSRNDDYSFVKE